MDEFPTILKARQFIRDAGNNSIPVDVERLAAAAEASIKFAYDLSHLQNSDSTSRVKLTDFDSWSFWL